MEDETTETETPDTDEEIVLTEEDDESSAEKVAAALFTAAAVVGAAVTGKKAVNFVRGKIAARKEAKDKETSTPESEPEKPETEEK